MLLFAGLPLITAKLANDARRLRHLASTDDLTGLSNLRAFEYHLEELIRQARLQKGSVSMLVLDVDRLKAFNDRYGHLTGADAVRTVGRIIPEVVPRPEPRAAMAATSSRSRSRAAARNYYAVRRSLNVLDGTVIGSCMPRHRHQEFLRFLRKLNRETPAGLQLHLIIDNYATHKHENVRSWLAQHPRFHLHFTPTSSSWLNLIERWFGELTRKRIRCDSFYTVSELVAAIDQYIRADNEGPKPFVWTAKVDDILTKVGRCKAVLETLR